MIFKPRYPKPLILIGNLDLYP